MVDISLLSTAMWAMGGTIAVSQDIGMAVAGAARRPARGAVQPAHRLLRHRPTVASSCSRCCRASTTGPRSASASGGPTSSTTRASTPHEHLMENAAVGAEHRPGRDQEVHARRDQGRSSPACAASGRSCRTRSRSPTTRRSSPTATCQELEYDGYPYKLVATPVQFDEEPSVPGKSPDFNEHGDEILTEHARPRLGHGHRPQGEGRRRLTIRTSRWTVRGPWGGCR